MMTGILEGRQQQLARRTPAGKAPKPGRQAQDREPATPFQVWAKSAVERRGVEINDIADAVGSDYSRVWKVLRGDPTRYKNTHPGFKLARDIGRFLGDETGALIAAGFTDAEPGSMTGPGEMGDGKIEVGSSSSVPGPGPVPVPVPVIEPVPATGSTGEEYRVELRPDITMRIALPSGAELPADARVIAFLEQIAELIKTPPERE